MDDINKVCDKYLPLICFAQYEESAEDVVQAFRNELKEAGIEEVTAYIQSIIDTHQK